MAGSTKLEIKPEDATINNIELQGLFIKFSEPEQVKQALQNFFATHLNVRPNITGVKRTGHSSFIIRFKTNEEKLQVLRCKSMMVQKGMSVYIKPQPVQRESEIEAMVKKAQDDEKDRVGQVTGVAPGLSSQLRTLFTATETLHQLNLDSDNRKRETLSDRR